MVQKTKGGFIGGKVGEFTTGEPVIVEGGSTVEMARAGGGTGFTPTRLRDGRVVSPAGDVGFEKAKGGSQGHSHAFRESLRKEAIQRQAEAARQAELARQEQARKAAESAKRAEIAKQAESARQREIAIGKASQTPTTPAFKEVGQKDERVKLDQQFKSTITRMPGESQAAFEFRARQVGRGIRQARPEAVKEFERQKKEQEKTEKITQEPISETQVSRGFSGGSFVGGVFKIGESFFDRAFSRIPEGTKLKIPSFIGAGGSIEVDVKKITEYQNPTASNIVRGTTDVFFKTAFFGPFLKTGAAKKGEARPKSQREQLQEFIDKNKVEEARETVGRFEDIFAKQGRGAVEKELVRSFKGLETPEAKADFVSLVKELVRRDIVQAPKIDLQPSYSLVKSTPPPTPTPPQPDLTINFETLRGLPEMQNIEGVLTAVKVIEKQDRVKDVKIDTSSGIQSNLQSNLPSITSLTRTTPDVKTKTRQRTDQIQMPKLRDIIKQKQPQTQAQPQLQMQKIRLKQGTRQIQSPGFARPKLDKPQKKKPQGFGIPRFRTPKLSEQPTGKFKVLGRRFGKFKIIGAGRTEKEAFAIGKRFTGKTLAASFKVPKAKRLKVPGFRTKKEKGEIIFIEPRKRRLKKRGTEVQEIKFFKSLKGGKKR